MSSYLLQIPHKLRRCGIDGNQTQEGLRNKRAGNRASSRYLGTLGGASNHFIFMNFVPQVTSQLATRQPSQLPRNPSRTSAGHGCLSQVLDEYSRSLTRAVSHELSLQIDGGRGSVQAVGEIAQAEASPGYNDAPVGCGCWLTKSRVVSWIFPQGTTT